MSGLDARWMGREVVGQRVYGDDAPTGAFTYRVVECVRTSSERRGEKRARSRLREGFVADGRRTVAECRIRDLSKRGARLQLEKDRPLPKMFLLTEAGSKKCYRATLVWQVGRDAGVKLIAIDDLV